MNKKCCVCGCGSLNSLDYKREILACSSCNHCFLDTDQATVSNVHFEQGEYLNWRIRNEKILTDSAKNRIKFISSFIKHGRVLEIGCSTGEALLELRKLGFEVTGTDLSDDALGTCKERGLQCYKQVESAMQLGKYDMIISFHVLEHIEDIDDYINTCKECLNPNGLVYLRMPNMDDLTRSVFKKNWTGFEPGHIQFFSQKSISHFLGQNGFRLEALATHAHVRPWLGGASRVLARGKAKSGNKKMPSDGLFRFQFYSDKILYPLLGLQDLFRRGSELVVVGKLVQ